MYPRNLHQNQGNPSPTLERTRRCSRERWVKFPRKKSSSRTSRSGRSKLLIVFPCSIFWFWVETRCIQTDLGNKNAVSFLFFLVLANRIPSLFLCFHFCFFFYLMQQQVLAQKQEIPEIWSAPQLAPMHNQNPLRTSKILSRISRTSK